MPGADLDGVRYLRTLADADRLKDDIAAGGRRVVVVGAGWIGLEVASAARGYGDEVTVLEPQPQPLRAALGDELGAVFADLHREHGVDLRLGTGVRELAGSAGHVTGVVTDAGDTVPADLVVVGVGITPNVELAAGAGLDVDDGVLVDAGLRVPDQRTHRPQLEPGGAGRRTRPAVAGTDVDLNHPKRVRSTPADLTHPTTRPPSPAEPPTITCRTTRHHLPNHPTNSPEQPAQRF